VLILSPDQIQEAADLLRQGKLVAFPTETVYGLGAPVFNPQAIAQIFLAKGRPADNPLIAHISSLDQVPLIACDIPDDFYKLAEAFFPGPLTVVLKKRPEVPGIVSGGLKTIAVRMPRHPVAQQLIALVGEPLVAPSANISGRPSSTSVAHVIADFDQKIAAVIDGGETEYGIESTVVSLIGKPFLLRPGAISQEQIEAVLGLELQEGTDGEKRASPGTRYRHYAPRAAVKLFTELAAMQDYVQGRARCLPVSDLKASRLYALLRQADIDGYEEVAIFCSPAAFADRALMDRLLKSSSS
jgi:L-threonylcarbamoyladenylate synthase